MRFTVVHETRYRYSAPVRLGPHRLRFRPRGEGTVDLAHDLLVDPTPVVRRDEIDRYGNPVTIVDFDGVADHFTIVSRFALETIGPPPPDERALAPLPWTPPVEAALADYHVAEADPSVHAFATDLAAHSGWSAADFLDRLNRTLHRRLNLQIRDGGAAQDAAHTLAVGGGACRDATVLFMAACHSLGLAARFVSGYQARAETPDGRRHLHAWPEVFLPGSGWHGYDPTHGVTVGDGHVAISAAPDQAATMPVEGGFWGDGVTSTLAYDVRITTAP